MQGLLRAHAEAVVQGEPRYLVTSRDNPWETTYVYFMDKPRLVKKTGRIAVSVLNEDVLVLIQ